MLIEWVVCSLVSPGKSFLDPPRLRQGSGIIEFLNPYIVLLFGIECSARTNVGVLEAFQELVQQIISTPSLWSSEASATSTNARNQPTIAAGRGSGVVQVGAGEEDRAAGWTGCSC